MKFDSGRARFGGKDITFKIARDDLQAFETYVGDSAYCLFRVLTAGQWMQAHVTAVQRFATMTAKQLAHHRSLAGLAISGISLSRHAKPGHVDATLAANAPAQYAGLATAVLGAALLGSGHMAGPVPLSTALYVEARKLAKTNDNLRQAADEFAALGKDSKRPAQSAAAAGEVNV